MKPIERKNNRIAHALLSAIFITIVLLLASIFAAGCTTSSSYKLQELNGPGCIDIQKDDLTINEAHEIDLILQEIGFDPIVSAAFDDTRQGFWLEESVRNDAGTQIGFLEDRHVSCVSENSSEQYWRNAPPVKIEGRTLSQSDIDECAHVCLVNRYLCINLFGSVEAASGKSIRINGEELEIIGVYQGTENFDIANKANIYIPYTVAPEISENIYFVSLRIIEDEPRELSSLAEDIFHRLNDKGYSVSVRYLDNNFEIVGSLSPGN